MNCSETPNSWWIGSPPRARGHVSGVEIVMFVLRFTPACAGTWPMFPAPCILITVHPRVRGDMWVGAVPAAPQHGSPPRARGHGQERHGQTQDARFTPACAGTWSCLKPRLHSRPVHPACAGTCNDAFKHSPYCPVHPRVRGDMTSTNINHNASDGSPPRARGHGRCATQTGPWSRFTPACAGT